MLILHETNSREWSHSGGQKTTARAPLCRVIFRPKWPPRSLGWDSTPCQKKAPPFLIFDRDAKYGLEVPQSIVL
jgi:hypothetical protein